MIFGKRKPWKYHTINFFTMLISSTVAIFAIMYVLLLSGTVVVSYITLDKELLLYGINRIFNTDFAFSCFRVSTLFSFMFSLLYVFDTKFHKPRLEEYMKG